MKVYNESLHLLQYILNIYNLKPTRFTLFHILFKNPHFPSLLSYIDVLSSFGVKTLSTKFTNKVGIKDIEDPFIAQVRINGGFRFYVCNKKEEVLICYDPVTNKKIKLHLDDFLQAWTNIAVILEDLDIESQHRLFKPKTFDFEFRLILSLVSVFLTFLLLVIIYNISSIALVDLLITIVSLIGFWLSVQITTLNKTNNDLLKKFCSTNTADSCNKILGDGDLNSFMGIKWSEWAAMYFLSQGVVCFIWTTTIPILSLIAGILTILFSFYSIWIQIRLGLFCKICSTLILLFYLQFILALNRVYTINIIDNLYASLLFSLFILIIILKKEVLHIMTLFDKSRFRINRFISSNIIYENLQQESTKVYSSEIPSVSLNPHIVNNKVLIITNPTCIPCRSKHSVIIDLLKKNENRLEILFLINQEGLGETLTSKCTILALYYLENLLIEKYDWLYTSNLSYQLNLINQEINKIDQNEIDRLITIIKKQYLWCIDNGITETPKVILSDRIMSDFYSFEDVLYLV